MSMPWELSRKHFLGTGRLALALSLPAMAQSTPPATTLPATTSPGSTQVVIATTCPASFYAAGASFNPQATPNLAGWYAIALPITKCEKAFQAYSITMNNLTPKGSGPSLTFTSTTSTGLAIPLKQVGPIDIFTFGTLGTSVSGKSSGLAGTWGGIAVVPIGRTAWRLTPWGQSIGGKWTGGLGIGRSY
jgi:hypothetical protein